MNLHKDPELFKELIIASSQALNLREVLIEKDYWVTYVLKNLSENVELSSQVVFKGGTSLSKAYRVIDRFSEDIDLALITDNESGNKIKSMLKRVEKGIVGELTEIQVEGITGKYSKYRKTVYEYPQIIEGQDFGQTTDKLLLEINSFTNPIPYSKMYVQSYAKDFLDSLNDTETIEKYNLEAVSLNVLSIERTFVEKLMNLVRLSYREDNIDQLKSKVRHLYDLHLLLLHPKIQELLTSKSELSKVIELIKVDDSNNHEFKGDWIGNRLQDSPLFKDNLDTNSAIESTYNIDFKGLVFNELPKFELVSSSISKIEDILIQFSF